MRAISLWQPWASLIAIGKKSVETRDWRPSPTLIGQPLAIHATATLRPECRETIDTEPFRSDLMTAKLYTPLDEAQPYRLPLGAIVAIARIRSVQSTDDESFIRQLSEREFDYGNYQPGRFGWVLHDVRALPEPIPAKGAQAIWNWQPPAEVLAWLNGEHEAVTQ